MKYIITLDEGTTSCRAVLFDEQLNLLAEEQKEFTQIYPQAGWVEHDPAEIYTAQQSVMLMLMDKNGIKPEDVACIGIADQRETTVIWDRKTGIPVYNAIVWQCRRTADICEDLVRRGFSDTVRRVTGLPVDAYFSATKIMWILDHVPGARERAERGELAFGTIDTWLLWNLTKGKVHATDHTNASRTMIYDIKNACWDENLCREFNIPMSLLPEVRTSSGIFGCAEINGVEIPISGIAGDQQASLFGQACFSKGEAKNTYGTGCFLLMNTGSDLIYSNSGLVTTLAATTDENLTYALEGSVFVGGAIIQWIRDELGLIRDARDSEYFSQKVPDTGGVYLVPAFTGLGAPYWDMYARGTIIGLTRGTRREHIIRAAQESIAYQSADLLAAMEKDTDMRIEQLKVDGGASRDKFLMQYQADILNAEVLRAAVTESTAMGAAALAALGVGIIESRENLRDLWKCGVSYSPRMSAEVREKKMSDWHRAVGRSRDWADHN